MNLNVKCEWRIKTENAVGKTIPMSNRIKLEGKIGSLYAITRRIKLFKYEMCGNDFVWIGMWNICKRKQERCKIEAPYNWVKGVTFKLISLTLAALAYTLADERPSQRKNPVLSRAIFSVSETTLDIMLFLKKFPTPANRTSENANHYIGKSSLRRQLQRILILVWISWTMFCTKNKMGGRLGFALMVLLVHALENLPSAPRFRTGSTQGKSSNSNPSRGEVVSYGMFV